MPLSKRSEIYQYSFSIEGVRYRGTTGTRDRRLAQLEENRLYKEKFLEAKLGKKKEITLGQALGRYWLEHASTQRWAATVDGFIRNMQSIWNTEILLSDIDNSKIADFITALKKKGLKAATINRHMEAFRKMYKLAANNWLYNVSPLDFGIHRQKEPDCRVRYLTVLEANRLIDEAAPHLKPIIKLALFTGLRHGNIINLQWKNVDLVGRRINIKVKSKLPGGKYHQVDMVEDCYRMLLKLQNEHREINDRVDYDQYVFLYKDKPLTRIKRGFKSACRRAKIEDFRFHDLRHTCASWLVQGNTPIEIVKDILGHSDISTTLKYAHHNQARKLEALESVFKTHLGRTLKIAGENNI